MLLCSGTARATDWKIIKHAGRDHVTLSNVSRFYSLSQIQRTGNSVTMRSGNRSLRGKGGSNELFINNLKFILSYPIAEHNGELIVSRMDLTKVIEPVMRPSRIKNAEKVDTIVLDAGHGGHDKGATCAFGNEKDFTLDVARRAKELLQQNGFKVHMTRSTDVFIPLESRTRIANKVDNALFVSIHFNSGGAGTGIETFTLAPRGVPSMASDGPRLSDLHACAGNVRDGENMALATAMHAALVRNSQLYDRGIKRARFVVIRDITIPGVLIECGFLSSSHDSRKVATPAYRQQLAQSILQAAQNYRRAVGASGDSTQVPTLVARITPSEASGTGATSDSPRVMIPTTQ